MAISNHYRSGHDGRNGRRKQQRQQPGEGEDADEEDVGRQAMEREMVRRFGDMGGGAEERGKKKKRKSVGTRGPRV